MTDLETQLSRYATAVAGPARHADDDEPMPVAAGDRGGRRIGFALAAGVLVVLVVAAGVLAFSRTRHQPSVSATTVANGLRLRLEVNTTHPGPTEQVTATLTVTNADGGPLSVPSLCPNDITIEDPSTTAAQDSPPRAGGTGQAPAAPEALAALFDPMRQGAVFEAAAMDSPCSSTLMTLGPGESRQIRAVSTPGPLGLDRVPMNVVGRIMAGPTVATLPFEVPAPPDGQLSRSEAIAVLTARPEVQQWATSVGFGQSAAIAATASGGPGPIPQTSLAVLPAGDGGWTISVRSDVHLLTAHINTDGSGTATADGVLTGF